MKKPLICFLMLLVSAGMYAQSHHSPGERGEKMAEKLSKRITVSAAQKDSLAATFKKFAEAKPHRGGDSTRLAALEQARDSKVKAILADNTKFQEYQKLVAEMKARKDHRGDRQGKGPHGHGKKGGWNEGVSTVPGVR